MGSEPNGKKMLHTSQRVTFIGLSILILIMFSFFASATSFETFNQWVEFSGFILIYGLIICMVIGLMLKKGGGKNEHETLYTYGPHVV